MSRITYTLRHTGAIALRAFHETAGTIILQLRKYDCRKKFNIRSVFEDIRKSANNLGQKQESFHLFDIVARPWISGIFRIGLMIAVQNLHNDWRLVRVSRGPKSQNLFIPLRFISYVS
jgi:hypothetical protein